MSGHLYGIGVGPGDPELLTIKAAKVLGRVDLILAASSTKNDDSLALDIARPHLKPDARVIRLGFPMSRNEGTLQTAWEENARLVLKELEARARCGLYNLGRPPALFDLRLPLAHPAHPGPGAGGDGHPRHHLFPGRGRGHRDRAGRERPEPAHPARHPRRRGSAQEPGGRGQRRHPQGLLQFFRHS